MPASDRRAAPRFRIGIPLHFQVAKSADPECAAESLDISSRGVLMETEAPPCIGAILLIRMRLPEMIMGWRVPEWRITSHVVHVESITEAGKFSVGVQFHYYEDMAPHRDRVIAEVDDTGVHSVAR
jgi:hypothetical protein